MPTRTLNVTLMIFCAMVALGMPKSTYAVEQAPLNYDVVVVGAGAGGVGAAIQAARLGVSVALLEETDWIGGQMSVVPTMDEAGFNPHSGLYGEFVDRVRVHYGRLGKSVGTCYSSPGKVCFEASVGQAILLEMMDDARRSLGPGNHRHILDLYLRQYPVRVLEEGHTVTGLITQSGQQFNSKVVIDATEYGDVLPLTTAPYRLAWFTNDQLKDHPKACVQDITYAVPIRKYFDGVPPELVMKNPPPGYTPELVQMFKHQVFPVKVPGPNGHPRSFALEVGYRGVPDSSNPESYTRDEPDKITSTSLNDGANDFAVDLNVFDRSQRKQIQCQAKLRTLQYLYYIQHDLGETKWSIANDEGFDTPYNREENLCPEIPEEFKAIERQFPPIPYVRESRRLIGVKTLTAPLLKRTGTPPVDIFNFPTAIAVGDYPVDLHACNTEDTLEHQFEHKSDQGGFGSSLGPFQVPLQTLIPIDTDGLMAAEKNISQSRLANGSTRLQPISMATGQAAGAMAALAVLQGIQPRQVVPGAVQRVLVDAGCRLTNLDFPDVPKMVRYWGAVQMVTTQGLMSAPQPLAFDPSHPLTTESFQQILDRLSPGLKLPPMDTVSRKDFQFYLEKATGMTANVDPNKPGTMSRAEAAMALADLLSKKDIAGSMQYWPTTR